MKYPMRMIPMALAMTFATQATAKTQSAPAPKSQMQSGFYSALQNLEIALNTFENDRQAENTCNADLLVHAKVALQLAKQARDAERKALNPVQQQIADTAKLYGNDAALEKYITVNTSILAHAMIFVENDRKYDAQAGRYSGDELQCSPQEFDAPMVKI